MNPDQWSPEFCDMLAKIFYLCAGLSFAVAMGGWVGYRHIQDNRRDDQ